MLDRLGTLTYADAPTALSEVWAHVEQFRRRLAIELNERLPIICVPERGTESGRLHVHILYGRYLDKRMVERCWGRGWVDLRRIRGRPDVPGATQRMMGRRQRCRMAASYVSSYVKKGFLEGHEFGRKRYSTTREMTPVRRQEHFHTFGGARAVAMLTNGRLVEQWSSESLGAAWPGPPVWVGYWDEQPERSRAGPPGGSSY